MVTEFSKNLALLRQESGLNQREAAAALGISQALLSHYENGLREPGLAFLIRVCDYFGVSADFMLGRTNERGSDALMKLAEGVHNLNTLADLLTGGGAKKP